MLAPLPTQRAIAEVLGALDDKIAANQAIVTTADALARAVCSLHLTTGAAVGQIAKITMGTSPKGEALNETGEGVEFYQGVRDFGPRVPTTPV
ncbi:MAG: hypothetical protein IPL43_08435 [Micropruina sp.]|nr:hypothetical protein [Micropruina sp.]